MKHERLAPQAPAARRPREKLTLGRKPAAVAPPAPIAANDVPVSVPLMFPLRLLRRAPENVRHTRIDEGCEEMADDIEAHGLLQSLIGYMDGEYVEVVGGGRRLKGLRIVRSRGRIDEDFLVPVLIRGREEAEELSLAENLQQKTMSPVAVGPFAGTPFAGRVHWPNEARDFQFYGELNGERGFFVAAEIFVTDAAIAAHRKEAVALVDQRLADNGGATA